MLDAKEREREERERERAAVRRRRTMTTEEKMLRLKDMEDDGTRHQVRLGGLVGGGRGESRKGGGREKGMGGRQASGLISCSLDGPSLFGGGGMYVDARVV